MSGRSRFTSCSRASARRRRRSRRCRSSRGAAGARRPLRICHARRRRARDRGSCERAGARLVAWGEPDYPAGARRGRRRAAAPVGARQCRAVARDARSPSSARATPRPTAGASRATSPRSSAQHGLVVVSGLARGIDAAAHEGALATGTIAVLAGGIDQVYPEENRALHDADRRARRAASPSMPVGTEPQARHFPRRNRIISGCSLGVLVVEAAFELGLAHHRALRARTGTRGVRGAGLAARSALPRHQRSDPQRRTP